MTAARPVSPVAPVISTFLAITGGPFKNAAMFAWSLGFSPTLAYVILATFMSWQLVGERQRRITSRSATARKGTCEGIEYRQEHTIRAREYVS